MEEVTKGYVRAVTFLVLVISILFTIVYNDINNETTNVTCLKWEWSWQKSDEIFLMDEQEALLTLSILMIQNPDLDCMQYEKGYMCSDSVNKKVDHLIKGDCVVRGVIVNGE